MTKHEDSLSLTQDATFDFTMGNITSALQKLEKALKLDPNCFDALLAKTEIYYAERNFQEALSAAEKAHKIQPEDILINTSLSRIWMELKDKPKAEYYGAQAKMLGWKQEILNPFKDPEIK